MAVPLLVSSANSLLLLSGMQAPVHTDLESATMCCVLCETRECGVRNINRDCPPAARSSWRRRCCCGATRGRCVTRPRTRIRWPSWRSPLAARAACAAPTAASCSWGLSGDRCRRSAACGPCCGASASVRTFCRESASETLETLLKALVQSLELQNLLKALGQSLELQKPSLPLRQSPSQAACQNPAVRRLRCLVTI